MSSRPLLAVAPPRTLRAGGPGHQEHGLSAIPDTHRDLLDAQVAVLGTVGASGRPQMSVIWFLAEGDTVKLSLNTSRQKVKNLQANPACSLLIIDPANPYRYVELRGDAAGGGTTRTGSRLRVADPLVHGPATRRPQ
jgi:PPOX class probable F420-dependent enzyme